MIFRKEPILAIDLFRKPVMREDLLALAQTIQNVIIIEQGTYPNDPLFGVGIKNYVFELLDNITISEIQSKIEEQITKYVLHEDINVEVSVYNMRSDNKNINALGIKINLSESNPTEVSSDKNIEIGYAYAGNNKTKRTVSKIIL